MFFLNFSLVIVIAFHSYKFDYTRVGQNYVDIDGVARKKYCVLAVLPIFGSSSLIMHIS